jgi:hypothetical protein
MALAHPGRNGISIADLPVQALFRLPHRRRNPGVHITYQVSHLIHVSWLKPRFFDILGVFVGYNPIKFVTIPKRVLDEVDVVSDPDIDAFFLDELAAEGIFFQISSLEIRSEASVT